MAYTTFWRNKFLTAEAKTIGDMVRQLRQAADQLEAMQRAGVRLEEGSDVADDYAQLVTESPEVAARFGFHEEVEGV